MSVAEYLEFKDYVCEGNYNLKQVERFNLQQLEQKTNLFKKLKINKDNSVLDISTGVGFFPYLLYTNGIKDITFSDTEEALFGQSKRSLFYQRGYKFIHEQIKLSPFALNFYRNQKIELPRRYDFITSIGVGFFRQWSLEEKQFLINNLLEYTNNLYIRVNDYTTNLSNYPKGFFYDKKEGCVVFKL